MMMTNKEQKKLYNELVDIIQSNTNADWQTENILKAMTQYLSMLTSKYKEKIYRLEVKERENPIEMALLIDELTEKLKNIEAIAAEKLNDKEFEHAEAIECNDSMELKPCPFCGNNVKLTNDDDEYFWITCTSCETSTRVFMTKEEVVEAWNKRV